MEGMVLSFFRHKKMRIDSKFLFASYLWLAFSLTGWAQSAHSDSLFAEGVRLYQQGDYEDAIPFFLESDKLDRAELGEDSPRASYSSDWAASCYYKLGNEEEARKLSPIIFKLTPVDRRQTVNSDLYISEALKALENNQYAEALNLYDKAGEIEHQIFPKQHYFHIGTYRMKAVCHYHLQQLDSAYLCMENALNITKKNYGDKDTLLVDMLNFMFNIQLLLQDFDKARELNDMSAKIVKSELATNHPSRSQVAYQYILLNLRQRKWVEAHDALPEYINILKQCFGHDTELLRGALRVIRDEFYNSGRTQEVAYINDEIFNLLERNNDQDYISTLLLNYAIDISMRDMQGMSEKSQTIQQLLSELPADSLIELRAAYTSIKCMDWLARGQLDEAKDVFLKIQEDSIESLIKDTPYYNAYLMTKGTISLALLDYENSIQALTEFYGLMEPEQRKQDLNIPTSLACIHAFAGNYQKSRELTSEIIDTYEREVIQNKALFRIDKDTAQVGNAVRMIEGYMKNLMTYHADSAAYALFDIKSQFLRMKARILTNIKQFALLDGYYECITDYAFELRRMGKYIEAQETMDQFLRDWTNAYHQLNLKSKKKQDKEERWSAEMIFENALYFRCNQCYEKGDPAGKKAHEEYIELMALKYGKESEDYLDAMFDYYEYLDDHKALLAFLETNVGTESDEWSAKGLDMMADLYEQEKQMDTSIKYRKQFVIAALRDSTYLQSSGYDLIYAIGDINLYYVNDKKDTLALLRYYQDELWPSLDVLGDSYIGLFLQTVNKLSYQINDSPFFPIVENEMKRRQDLFESPILRGCVYQSYTHLFMSSSEETVNFTRQACECTKDDPTLHLLFRCRLHEAMTKCSKDSVDAAIRLGNELIQLMNNDEKLKYTHEYANLVGEQVELLLKAKRFDEVISLSESYLKDFSNKNSDELLHVFNSEHPMYPLLECLNWIGLSAWSYEVSLPTVHNALYAALSLKEPSSSGQLALNIVHDAFRRLNTSMSVNNVSTWQCDDLINTTSKLAFVHQTDSLCMYAYDTALFCKGLQLRSNHAIRSLILQSGHKSAVRKYDELEYTLTLMAQASEEQIDSLQKRRDELENDLRRLSNFFGDYKKKLYMSWKDVQQVLTDEDIAIEFTFVEKDYNDKYVTNNQTLQEGYYACILKKGMTRPEVVFIMDRDSIDISPEAYTSTLMTRRIIHPLLPYMKGVKNIYFSPIGKLNQLAIEVLPRTDDAAQTLSSIYNLYRLSSTREIVEKSNHFVGRDAVVYGGLAYDATLESMEEDAEHYEKNLTRDVIFKKEIDVEGLRGVVSDIPYLAGTLIEAENVVQAINLANAPQLRAQMVEGTLGTEASFKSLDGKQKRVIHLATHGFYFSSKESEKANNLIGRDTEKLGHEDRSLMQSGLLMVGADNKYQGEIIPEGIEDGILTAYEIANTDLSGLDLCVLSACQTAQGEISSEGVFGLQRGFKKAGANSILMSLWKVDDEATCLLMSEFYNNWIGKGMSKYAALEEARQTVRSHKERGWDNPRYWASFILLDGLE